MRFLVGAQQRVVAVVYVAAVFMAILDTTIVNVALPTIGRAFHDGSSGVGSISIAYLVSLTVVIPVSGWLGDRVGGRRALLGAVALFTLASALCGSAGNLTELVAFRILQGIGAAVMTPVGLSMLFRVYEPAERVRISSVLAVVTALAPALGPVLGGLFTTELSWRLVFFVNVPIGVAALLFGAGFLDGHLSAHPRRLDLRGLMLSVFGVGALMYGVSEGPIQGWTAAPVLTTVTAGIALVGTLVLVELRAEHPLVDIRLLGNRLFGTATALYGLASAVYLGALYLAALFLQNALGISAINSGLTVFPSALAVMAGSQLVTRGLYRRVGPRRLISTGLLLITIAMVLMAQVTTNTSLWFVRLVMIDLGLGVSLVFIPNQAMSMATIHRNEIGRASSLFNAGKQLGGALGVAMSTTILSALGTTRHVGGHTVANLTAYHDAFLAASAVALISTLMAATVDDSEAAATMVARKRAPA